MAILASKTYTEVEYFKGVDIFKCEELVQGSEFDFDENGVIYATGTPEYTTTYQYNGGFPYDSLKDIKTAISMIWDSVCDQPNAEEDFSQMMNGDMINETIEIDYPEKVYE